MTSDAKNLYRTEPDKNLQWNWTDKYPEDIIEAAENEETANFAFPFRNIQSYNGRRKLNIHSIVIQNPLLRRVLRPILRGYSGITTGIERLEFEAPFRPLIHRWKRPEKAVVEASTDCGHNLMESKSWEHLQLLFGVLSTELKNTIEAKHDLVSHNVITYNLIWIIFEPGGLIQACPDGHSSAFRLDSAAYKTYEGKPYFQLNCWYVDWVGDRFGRARRALSIPCFDGTTPILKLSAFPLSFDPQKAKTKSSLLNKGKTFENLRGCHQKNRIGLR